MYKARAFRIDLASSGLGLKVPQRVVQRPLQTQSSSSSVSMTDGAIQHDSGSDVDIDSVGEYGCTVDKELVGDNKGTPAILMSDRGKSRDRDSEGTIETTDDSHPSLNEVLTYAPTSSAMCVELVGSRFLRKMVRILVVSQVKYFSISFKRMLCWLYIILCGELGF